MSRKDTIVIAVLINAGLLVVLFASALKTDPVVEQPIVRQQIEIPKPKLERKQLVIPEQPKVVAAAPKPEVKVEKQPPLPDTPKAKPKPQLPKHDEKTVVVQSGDALEKIARRNGVSVASLMEANGLKSTALKIGQELVIPSGGAKIASPAPVSGPKYYEVRAGDSPWTIASKNKIKL
ncbi:MAG TPA: LysM peptidoglycan-binding domain-containing protein, partial [Chlamydiales bacterium]|nr:LysM peptidoglycan-binding domain-containing protein [Chlamydiales bacterium]